MKDVSTKTTQVTNDKIAKRAYELYTARGCKEGFAEQDWLTAEAELSGKTTGTTASKTVTTAAAMTSSTGGKTATPTTTTTTTGKTSTATPTKKTEKVTIMARGTDRSTSSRRV